MYPPCSTVLTALTFRSAHIYSTSILHNVFFASKREGSLRLLSGERHEPVREKETYFYHGVTLPSKGPKMNQWTASFAQKCVQVAILPLIVAFYFSTITHYPLSNKLLRPTASSYKMIILHLFQEYSTAYPVIPVAEPLFSHCDKKCQRFQPPFNLQCKLKNAGQLKRSLLSLRYIFRQYCSRN